MDFNVTATGFTIRPAFASDTKALRMLLPGMIHGGVGLVAVDGRHQLVIGAAAATSQFRQEPCPGPGVAVHVIESCRGKGIGRKLMDHLAAAVRATDATALYAAQRVELDSKEMRGWKSLGFEVCETVQHDRLDLATVEPELERLIELIRLRGRIPKQARVIPLYQADLQAVLQLHLDYLGGDPVNLRRRLRGEGTDGFLPQYSRVLVIDGVVRGCLVGHRHNADTMVIDAGIVDSTLRSGWAATWLRLEAARGVLHLRIKNIEYTTFDHYVNARNTTQRLGGETKKITALMTRRLGA